MPKIVDRQRQKQIIADQAAALFSEYGYSGLSMREIAKHLTLSKSALYHYFPSKQALFDAATIQAIAGQTEKIKTGFDAHLSMEVKLKILHQNMCKMEAEFAKEIVLLIDYLRLNKAMPTNTDPNIQFASQQFEQTFTDFVGEDNAYPVQCLYYGAMLQRMLDGKASDMEKIHRWLNDKLLV